MLQFSFKEFKKNQEGKKAIQTQLNNIQTFVDTNANVLNNYINAYTEEVKNLNGKIAALQDTVNTFEWVNGWVQ